MFAYFIIGIELIILYCVFWVVFIREPQPREIRAELWGRYQRRAKVNETVDLFDRPTKFASFLPSRIRARLFRMMRRRKRHHHLHAKHQCWCACHERSIAGNWHGQLARFNVHKETSRELAEKLSLILNKTLNKFSTKIPY